MIFRAKQLIFRQMTQVLTITQLGNPILQQKAAAIDNLLDADCQNLIDSLISTVQAAHGVGIAAPQVARSLRLFIVASHPNPRYPDAPIGQGLGRLPQCPQFTRFCPPSSVDRGSLLRSQWWRNPSSFQGFCRAHLSTRIRSSGRNPLS